MINTGAAACGVASLESSCAAVELPERIGVEKSDALMPSIETPPSTPPSSQQTNAHE